MVVIYTPVIPTNDPTDPNIKKLFVKALKSLSQKGMGVLLNPYHHSNYRKRSIREIHEGFVICDSGGYQLYSNARVGIDINPLRTMSFAKFNNVDVLIGFDLPVYLRKSNNTLKHHARLTKKYTELYSMKYDSVFYNVLHGHGLEEMKLWYGIVKDIDGTEGYAVSPENLVKNFNAVLGVLFLYEKGIRNFHILGTNRKDTYFYTKILSEYLGDIKVSFDTANELHFARNLSYVQDGVTFCISTRNSFKTIGISRVLREGAPDCSCIACKYFEDFSRLNAMRIVDKLYLIYIHNTFVTLHKFMTQDEYSIVEQRLIDFIEVATAEGVDRAYSRYRPIWHKKSVKIPTKYQSLEEYI